MPRRTHGDGIKDFRFHDLRHTFASRYMMNEGDLYELAKILGHSDSKDLAIAWKLFSMLYGRSMLPELKEFTRRKSFVVRR
ncbi:MAG TPA: tyrosine-type recombinase/integrase [Pyrinomonadaceae bacterium]|nr:tyrosine-type recombinase/integrase [Pyrinomonadaceae bacterium]